MVSVYVAGGAGTILEGGEKWLESMEVLFFLKYTRKGLVQWPTKKLI